MPPRRMIRARRADGHRVVVLDRPERRNALAPEDLDRLAAAVTEATESVVLVRGAGEAFCAGADLDAVDRLDDPEAFARHGQATMRAVADADPVVVAGVDGPARGGGVELALACDLRVATPAATFAEPGVSLGLLGAWGGTRRLPRVVGESDAVDLSVSGRVVGPEAARRMGLVSRVVAPDELAGVAREIAANDADATAVVRDLLRAAPDRDREPHEAAEAAAFAACHRRRDLAERSSPTDAGDSGVASDGRTDARAETGDDVGSEPGRHE